MTMLWKDKHHIWFYTGLRKQLYAVEFGYSAPERSITIGPRIRDSWLLHFVAAGSCTFCGQQVSAGNIFLIAPGLSHNFTVGDNYEHFWVSFAGEQAPRLLECFGISPEHHKIASVTSSQALVRIFQAAFESGEREEQALSALTSALNFVKTEGNPLTGYAQITADFLEKNFHRRLTMEQAAQQANISEKHLYRLFKEEFGISPQQYLMKIRMERARSLLVSTDLSIREIADSVGYPSQLAFSAVFKRYYGIPPTTMRNAAENNDI